MADAPQAADAPAPEKVKVNVQAEFWIDPLDHVPLAQRREMLLGGGQAKSTRSVSPCGVDAASKQVTPRLLLEVFMSEFARALKPLCMHGCREQNVTKSSSRDDLNNGQSSGKQIYDGRSEGILNNAVTEKFGPVQTCMAVNSEDRHTFEDCRSQDSLPNVCQFSYVIPCFDLKCCSSGQRYPGVGCGDIIFSLPDCAIKVKVEPSDITTENDQEHCDPISLHEQCNLSPYSIAGECCHVDVSLEADHCYSSLAEARNVTPTQGRAQICYSEVEDQRDLPSHARSDVKVNAADKLNDGNNIDTEFPSEKCAVNSSEVNGPENIHISMGDIQGSSVALSSCMAVGVPSVGVSNQCGVSFRASNLQGSEGNDDINSGRKCDAESIEALAGLQEQSLLKANKRHAISTLTTDPERMKYEFGENNCPSGESAAKRLRTSISVYSESCTSVKGNEVLSDACKDNFFSGTSNLLERVAQTPTVAEKETHFRGDCLLHGSSLTTSTSMVKVEPSDLQEHEGCMMLSYRTPVDVPVVVKGTYCSNTSNQSSDGSFSFSPGRAKVESSEDINAVCSSGTTTATKFSTLAFDAPNNFEGGLCQTLSCSTFDMQTIQEGETMCSDDMSANLPGAINPRVGLPGSALSTFPKTVKAETLEGNHVGSASETEITTNVSRSAYESFGKAVGMTVCAGIPVVEEETCHNMASSLPDSALSTFPMRVKDEPVEEDRAVSDSGSKAKKYSSLPIFDSPNNAVESNLLPDLQCPSKAINCQCDTPSRVCSVQNDKKTNYSSSQVSMPEVTGIVTGQKQTCLANQHLDSDVSASKGIKIAEQLEERCSNIASEITSGILNGTDSSSKLILKSEPVENDFSNLIINPLGSFISDMLPVEAKSEVVDVLSIDILDQMPLTERIKMLTSNIVSEKPARKSRCFKQTRVHAVSCDSKSSTHRRKRKKTATDSVEIALEEDAPGLLQGLIDRGINLDEIKLYGCGEDVEALDILSNEDSFKDLEALISKLFSERPTSLFKLAPLRPAKGTKAVYCLACLISLIEQTRYLRFRNRPVEWGWCRDLQSFIFVFKMHNRIVLERPEYGYATYFFELVESFPIDWQIKRLVTAMKLTSCSRATLIENKSLLVGVDLSEGEACVLEEYGWRPNTGLGSMLNYCDRVVHDRNERDTSEWRLKIGKLLMEGYDGGQIIKVDLPKKVMDYVGSHYPEIKMETI